jgi:hypothetical protein
MPGHQWKGGGVDAARWGAACLSAFFCETGNQDLASLSGLVLLCGIETLASP